MSLIREIFGAPSGFSLRSGSLENPRTSLSDPAAWLWDAFGAAKSDSGVVVTPESAMRLAAVYACVRIIAESVASLPCITYEKLGPRKKRRATDLAEYDLIRWSPNPQMTSIVFWETVLANVLGWGNGYAEIQRDAGNRIVALWPRAAARTTPFSSGSELFYKTTDTSDGSSVTVPAHKMLHIPGLGFNGVIGMSPITAAKQAIGLGLAAEKFGAKLFSNGAQPGGVLEHPGTLTSTGHQLLKKSWEDAHAGLDNAHKVAILEGGLKWAAVGINPNDAQFLETRKFQKSDIASIFRIPPHLIGDLEKATFSNIEQQEIEFVTYTLRPWAIRIEQEVKRKLFGPKPFYCEFLVDGLLRGEAKARHEGFAIGRNWGYYSVNDIREIENLDAVDNGDIYLQPLNMVEAGTQTPVSATAGWRRVLREAVSRVAAWQTRDREKIAAVFSPILSGMAEAHGAPQPETLGANFAAGLAARAMEWKPSEVHSIVPLEFSKFLEVLNG